MGYTLPPVRYVDVDGDVAYREWTAQEPDSGATVVCVHGMGEMHLSWSEIAPELAKRRRVVALDLPGYGLSPRRGRQAMLDDLRKCLTGFIEAVVPDERPVIAGNSMGGGVAAFSAARTPELVSGLVLTSAYLPPVFDGWKCPWVITRLLGERIAELMRMVKRGGPYAPGTAWFTEAALRATVADGDALDRRFLRRHEELATNRPADHLDALTFAESFLSLVTASVYVARTRREYAAIECPVLILHGRADHEVPIGWARSLHQTRPDWAYVELAGTGHVAQLEHPQLWIDAVEPWLDRIDAHREPRNHRRAREAL